MLRKSYSALQKEQALQKIDRKIKVAKVANQSYAEIDNMGRKTFTGKLELTSQEYERLKQLARNGITVESELMDLKRQLQSAKRDTQIWKRHYEQLEEQTKDFLAALKRAPERVKAFISKVLHVEQEWSSAAQRKRADITC